MEYLIMAMGFMAMIACFLFLYGLNKDRKELNELGKKFDEDIEKFIKASQRGNQIWEERAKFGKHLAGQNGMIKKLYKIVYGDVDKALSSGVSTEEIEKIADKAVENLQSFLKEKWGDYQRGLGKNPDMELYDSIEDSITDTLIKEIGLIKNIMEQTGQDPFGIKDKPIRAIDLIDWDNDDDDDDRIIN